MRMSRRAQRMSKQNSRINEKASLNLVSLMDIFTILVFFLMFNQSDNQIVQNDKITLPQSYATKVPKDSLVIMISADDIMVQNRPVVKVADIMSPENKDELIIPALKEELEYQAKRSGPLTGDDAGKGRRVTIVGDNRIPYEVLKKVMSTCSDAEFSRVALAVTQKAAPKAGGGA